MSQYVYLIQAETPTGYPLPIKIGVSANPYSRCADMQTGSPYPLAILCTLELSTRAKAMRLERMLHAEFSDSRTGGEWFSLDFFDADRRICELLEDVEGDA